AKVLTFKSAAPFALAALLLGAHQQIEWHEILVGAPPPLMITLFASWAWGFTLNRVSLFALIFSIGILVDDAIVVVENIHRHMAMGKRKLSE
ncbi:efflux RND transporter permease subunit, partial [Vibrio cholerae]|uniref:efflux RND transporter permease subunit n=1 Tax=Vibrio cholerae TaxID=666 RepID=UPI0020CDAA40